MEVFCKTLSLILDKFWFSKKMRSFSSHILESLIFILKITTRIELLGIISIRKTVACCRCAKQNYSNRFYSVWYENIYRYLKFLCVFYEHAPYIFQKLGQFFICGRNIHYEPTSKLLLHAHGHVSRLDEKFDSLF